VDLVLSRLLPALEKAGGVAMITADHGNADRMFQEKDGKRIPHVAHTLNPVPCILLDYSGANRWTRRQGIDTPGLSNVAATLCNLVGLAPPEDYDPPLYDLA
jgi:2,3-bisphosphoglycerate-independent phosphoglycerate mutase